MRRKHSCLAGPLAGFAHRRCRVRRQEARQRAAAEAVRTSWQEDLADDPISATALGDHALQRQAARHVGGGDRPRATSATTCAWPRCARSTRKNSRRPTSSTTTCSSARSRRASTKYSSSRGCTPSRTFDGPQLLAEVAEFAPFKTVKDYDNWIARINASGVYIDQWIVLLTQGATERRTQPRITIQKVLEQIKPQLRHGSGSEPVLRAVQEDAGQHPGRREGPAAPPPPRPPSRPWRCRRSSASTSSSATSIYPRRATRSASTTRRTASCTTATASSYYTTIDNLDAARIHNIGLEEVKRIRAEMEKTLEGINFLGTLDQFLVFIRTDPRFFYKTPEELMAAYEKTARGIEPQLPKLFGKLPKTPFGIRADSRGQRADDDHGVLPAAVTRRRAAGQLLRESLQAGVAADLGNRGADRARVRAGPSPADRAVVRAHGPAGIPPQRGLHGVHRRLGAVLREASATTSASTRTTSRRSASSTTTCGARCAWWSTPACTQFKWTRDQAIYFFKQNTGKSEQDIDNEVDRYISWPGQALAYKLGQLRIQALRAEAEKALGDALRYPRVPRPAPRQRRIAPVRAGHGNACLDRRAERAAVIVDRSASHHVVLQVGLPARRWRCSSRAQRVSAAARCRLAWARRCAGMSSRFSSNSISKRARDAARLAAA